MNVGHCVNHSPKFILFFFLFGYATKVIGNEKINIKTLIGYAMRDPPPRVKYDVSFEPNDSLLRRRLSAIEMLDYISSIRQNALIGNLHPKPTDKDPTEEFKTIELLNQSQEKTASLASSNDFTIIQ